MTRACSFVLLGPESCLHQRRVSGLQDTGPGVPPAAWGSSSLGVPSRPLLIDALLASSREILASKVTKALPVGRASLVTLGSQATKVTQASWAPRDHLGRTGRPVPQGLQASQDFQG